MVVLKITDSFAVVWFGAFNALAFIWFGFDKWRSRRAGQRTPESFLVLLGAVGGWPGGLLGMIFFRHKTVKWTFQLKYALGLIPFVAEVWAFFHWR
jgi:uncharacterized membrane protein YsdA (DUF1294 family)